MYEVTVTHTIRLPDGYELAPGPQPRVPAEADRAAGYSLLLGALSPSSAMSSPMGSNQFKHNYFILARKPLGVKLTFVDVRKFEDVPKQGFYGTTHGFPGEISAFTAQKNFENKNYGHQTLAMLVSYYATESIYAPAS